MAKLVWLQQAFEYLGGSRDEAPHGFPMNLSNFVFWGIWWAGLSVLIYIFSGQSSKFIYIDF